MLLRRSLLIATVLIATLAVACLGKPDPVTEAKKAIQTAYDKEAAAAAKLDVNGIYAFHSPNFIFKDSVQDETLKFRKEKTEVFLKHFKSIKQTITIKKFRLKDKVATVTITMHQVAVMINPDTNKPMPTDVSDYKSVDTWVKGDKGWLMTASDPK